MRYAPGPDWGLDSRFRGNDSKRRDDLSSYDFFKIDPKLFVNSKPLAESGSLASSHVYLAGHAGLVGSALHRRLLKIRGLRLTVAPRRELDLTRYAAVERFIRARQPGIVINAAGLVGGIGVNAILGVDACIRSHVPNP